MGQSLLILFCTVITCYQTNQTEKNIGKYEWMEIFNTSNCFEASYQFDTYVEINSFKKNLHGTSIVRRKGDCWGAKNGHYKEKDLGFYDFVVTRPQGVLSFQRKETDASFMASHPDLLGQLFDPKLCGDLHSPTMNSKPLAANFSAFSLGQIYRAHISQLVGTLSRRDEKSAVWKSRHGLLTIFFDGPGRIKMVQFRQRTGDLQTVRNTKLKEGESVDVTYDQIEYFKESRKGIKSWRCKELVNMSDKKLTTIQTVKVTSIDVKKEFSDKDLFFDLEVPESFPVMVAGEEQLPYVWDGTWAVLKVDSIPKNKIQVGRKPKQYHLYLYPLGTILFCGIAAWWFWRKRK